MDETRSVSLAKGRCWCEIVNGKRRTADGCPTHDASAAKTCGVCGRTGTVGFHPKPHHGDVFICVSRRRCMARWYNRLRARAAPRTEARGAALAERPSDGKDLR